MTLTTDDTSVDLAAWSYCYGNRCINGAPPSDPTYVRSLDEVGIDFPLPDWSFTAYFSPSGESCGRVQGVPLERSEDEGVLRPAGYADEYDVTLFGRRDGNLSVTFRWTTPVQGPLPDRKRSPRSSPGTTDDRIVTASSCN